MDVKPAIAGTTSVSGNRSGQELALHFHHAEARYVGLPKPIWVQAGLELVTAPA
jgi:hypothetical protein